MLIGLPGSGKTTVGALLAQRLHRPLLDTDAMVEEREGRTIPEIFAQRGEAYFRAVEAACAAEAARRQDAVIATGGGIVLRQDTMELLRHSGVVCFLDRAAQEIAESVDVSGRPLLKDRRERIFQLQKERDHLYRRYAHGIYAGAAPAELAEAIAADYEQRWREEEGAE